MTLGSEAALVLGLETPVMMPTGVDFSFPVHINMHNIGDYQAVCRLSFPGQLSQTESGPTLHWILNCQQLPCRALMTWLRHIEAVMSFKSGTPTRFNASQNRIKCLIALDCMVLNAPLVAILGGKHQPRPALLVTASSSWCTPHRHR